MSGQSSTLCGSHGDGDKFKTFHFQFGPLVWTFSLEVRDPKMVPRNVPSFWFQLQRFALRPLFIYRAGLQAASTRHHGHHQCCFLNRPEGEDGNLISEIWFAENVCIIQSSFVRRHVRRSRLSHSSPCRTHGYRGSLYQRKRSSFQLSRPLPRRCCYMRPAIRCGQRRPQKVWTKFPKSMFSEHCSHSKTERCIPPPPLQTEDLQSSLYECASSFTRTRKNCGFSILCEVYQSAASSLPVSPGACIEYSHS